MNRRSWVLLGTVVVFAGLLVYTLRGGDSGGGTETTAPKAFWQEDRNAVRQVEVQAEDGDRLVLERSTGAPAAAVTYHLPERFQGKVASPFDTYVPPGPETEWWIVEPERVPADPSAVSSLLFTLAEPRPGQEAAAQEAGGSPDLKPFGLDPPRATVRLHVQREAAEPVTRELRVGEATPLRSSTGAVQSYYVQAAGRAEVYTLPSYPIEKLFEGAGAFRMMQFARFETADATALRLLWADKPPVELVRAGETWRLERPERVPADASTVQDLLYDLNLLRADQVVSENASDEELAEYGLDNPRGEAVVWLRPEPPTPQPEADASGGTGEASGPSTEGAGAAAPAEALPRARVLWVGDFLSDGSGVYVRLASDRRVYRVRGDRLQRFWDTTADPLKLAQRSLLPQGWRAGSPDQIPLQRVAWKDGDAATVLERGDDGAWKGSEEAGAFLQELLAFRATQAVAVGREAEAEAGWSPGGALPEGAQQMTLEPEGTAQPSAPVTVTRLPGEEDVKGTQTVRLLWAAGEERLLLHADPADWQRLTEHL
ncbi:DUF4340 domain-containing protein [Limnochorda pilosa]|uniref:DUF4340 domain-containing protein n=1 Tax=Limnochorda pilosa TaxID=1555112 RepID=A0A0K2SFM8_LIMPI|nr:DUF4340 domain-containing protein [Limnochorda pilosa]BAS25895.1 hypothetical protein LIP_0036 [Limnochorda pilosa]